MRTESRRNKHKSLFSGVTTGAKWSARIGFILFMAGTIAVALHVALKPGGDPLVTIGLPAVWLIIVISRIAVTTTESDFAAFMELMKWQIAIAAAAAAIVAPIGLDPDGSMRSDFKGPVYLFLSSSILAAIGYALAREAWSQHLENQERDKKTRTIQIFANEVATALTASRPGNHPNSEVQDVAKDKTSAASPLHEEEQDSEHENPK